MSIFKQKRIMNLSRIGLILAPILVTSATFFPSQVRAQSRITSVGDAALNAADHCQKKAPAFVRNNPTYIKIVGIRCSEIVHKVVASLRAAKYRPTGLNLQSDRDLTVFINRTSPILVRDASVTQSIRSARVVFSDDVIETILLGSIGAYAYLDFGIDITHNSRNRTIGGWQAAIGGNSRASSRSNSSPVALPSPNSPPPYLPSPNLSPMNAQKKISEPRVLAQISNSVCKKYVTVKPKNDNCNRLTVNGMLTLNGSKLDTTGVDFENDSQREAYIDRGVSVLLEDTSFMNLLISPSSHLTREEQVNILRNVTVIYGMLKKAGY
ncbi:hypothetical protein [Brasilonema octagenarum]|nr:hypothetical protein [Brasilonema octagenarum]